MMMSYKKIISIWLLIGCLLVFVMVVIGGITRLTQSGLSMVHWRFFKDNIYPSSELDWRELFDKYKQFPEYQKKNLDYTLTDFKKIFFWEYIHRVLGKIIGLVFFLPFLWFLIKKKLHKKLFLRLLIVLFMGLVQGYIGWWMVRSGLIDLPDVSHIRLSVHLVFALLTFGYTFWVFLKENHINHGTSDFFGLKKFLNFFLILVFLQIIYGGFTAGLDAGKIINTWPKMNDFWIPFVNDFSIDYLINNRVIVQFVHRTIAGFIFLSAIIFFLRAMFLKTDKGLKRYSFGLVTIVSTQFFLGVFTLIFSVPVRLGAMHQAGAFVLIGFIVYGLVISDSKITKRLI